MSGTYVHSDNPGFRYRGIDDGGTLWLSLERTAAEAADGGAPGVALRLTRSPKGFAGEATGVGLRGAVECPVRFPTELTACFDGGLALRSAATASFDERCQPPPSGPPPLMLDQTLLRERNEGVNPGGSGMRPEPGGR